MATRLKKDKQKPLPQESSVPIDSVTLRLETVLPHDYIMLGGALVVADLIEAVMNGRITATLTTEFNVSETTLGHVPQYLRECWLKRLADDKVRVEVERKKLDGLQLDEYNRLTQPFLAWLPGTPFSDVQSWFGSQAS